MPGFVHIALHICLPLAIAWFFFRPIWSRAALIMLAANLVDLDFLWSGVAYASTSCRINAFPLHTMLPISIYGALMFFPVQSLRLLGIGLVTHMLVDAIGCGL